MATLLNMIDMYKLPTAVVEAFENPYYKANGIVRPSHAQISHIVVVHTP